MSNIIPTIRYLWLTAQHKVYVLRAGLRTRAPIWRLVIHDWSKFTPAEAPHYGRQFFGTKDDANGFARAWLHHIQHNPHHWEHHFAWASVAPSRSHTRNAADAASMESESSSAMAALSGTCARSAIGDAKPSGSPATPIGASATSNTSALGTSRKVLAGSANSCSASSGRCSHTTVEIPRAANAAGRTSTSSWRWIMPRAVANSTGSRTTSCQGFPPTDGPSRTGSPPSSESSATTATARSRSSAIARTSVLIDGRGGKCLACGEQFGRERFQPLPMPEWAVREMVADWMGASRAYEGRWPEDRKSWRWLKENLGRRILPRVHPQTANDIRKVLSEVFGPCETCGDTGRVRSFSGSCFFTCADCTGEPPRIYPACEQSSAGGDAKQPDQSLR